MTLRPARVTDAPGVAAIWNHYIRTTTVTFNPVEKTEAEVAEAIQSRPVFLVAERDGRIAGFSTYGEFRRAWATGAARSIPSCLRPMRGAADWDARC